MARLLHRAGHAAIVIERQQHPRFCIGESLLPCTNDVWQELDLLPRLEGAGFLPKHGAYFVEADGMKPEYFHFGDGAGSKHATAFEVTRSEFDKLLWDAAVDDGVPCFDQVRVTGLLREGPRVAGVTVEQQGDRTEIRARLTVDCTGRATLLGRELGLRTPDPFLDTVALFTHYDNVILASDEDAGTIGIIGTSFGWMWFIPFAGHRASVGAVVSGETFKGWKREGLDRDGMWDRILEEVRAVRVRVAAAERSRPVETTANFSYRCSPIAGPGWVLVGDAAAFLDPVFSSGVHLAMTGASKAARDAARALRRSRVPDRRDFARYERATANALKVFTRFIYSWYDPWFRWTMMHPPEGRPGVDLLKRHIIRLLAGDVFQPWKVLPPLYVMIGLSKLTRWGDRRRGRIAPPQR